MAQGRGIALFGCVTPLQRVGTSDTLALGSRLPCVDPMRAPVEGRSVFLNNPLTDSDRNRKADIHDHSLSEETQQ